MSNYGSPEYSLPQNWDECKEFIKPSPIAAVGSFVGSIALAANGEMFHEYTTADSVSVVLGITAIGMMLEPTRKLGLILESKIREYLERKQNLS